MEKLDRTTQPDIKTLNKIILPKPTEVKLDNGVSLFYFNAGTQEVIKMECLFTAGTWFQKEKLVAYTTVKMLSEGTKNYSAAELADFFDSHGAYFATEAEKDYTSVTLYCLKKHLASLLPTFTEMLRESTFPEKEMSVLLNNTRQEQMVSMQKVSYLARVNFAELIFGKEHPYGQYAKPDDYEKVTTAQIKKYHQEYYHPGNLRIIASGKIDETEIKLINKFLGDTSWETRNIAHVANVKITDPVEKKLFVPKENSIQSGIRIGKPMITKTHPDYLGMIVLNTMLGGYFGSRLMTNIREDKGYTYGIGSGMLSLRNAGFFFIGSEVGADVREKAVIEVYKEIAKLREEPISDDELSLVKSYMAGTFLRSMDGPFAIAERFLGLLDTGLDFNEYYTRFLKTIKEITPQQLQELANTYLAEPFHEVVAGK
jgi:zinc protease